MGSSTWIEAALNGPWGRERQPRMPVTVDEIVAEGIACAGEGAAIIHVHAYDEETGRQRDDWETYARIIEGIRSRVDVIAYPTIPIAGSGFAGGTGSASERYAHLDELARRGLVEWAVVDPGSVNFSRFDAIGRGESGFVYLNPEDHVREGLRICAAHGVVPSFAIYEPGFTRAGAALCDCFPGAPRPIYRFMFSNDFAWGFPPRNLYVDAHLALLQECAPGAPWMAAGLGVDIAPLVEGVVARGGHLRGGLEDAQWGVETSNREIIAALVGRVLATGGDIATAPKIRDACGGILAATGSEDQ
jgi:3-keto-5-aminohexanoate cleavage enzyme